MRKSQEKWKKSRRKKEKEGERRRKNEKEDIFQQFIILDILER